MVKSEILDQEENDTTTTGDPAPEINVRDMDVRDWEANRDALFERALANESAQVTSEEESAPAEDVDLGDDPENQQIEPDQVESDQDLEEQPEGEFDQDDDEAELQDELETEDSEEDPDIENADGNELLEQAREKVTSRKVRIEPQDEVEELALKDLKYRPGYEGKKLSELLAIAERILHPESIVSPKPDQVKSDPDQEDAEPGEDNKNPLENLSADELESKVESFFDEADDLEAEADQLDADCDWEAAKAKRAEVRDLRKQARIAEHQVKVVREQEQEYWDNFDRTYEAAQASVIEDFPDAAEEGSHFRDRMILKSMQLRESEDPLLQDPNLPRILADQVAAELKLSPSSQKKTVAAKQGSPSRNSNLRELVPASQAKSLQTRRKAAPSPAPGAAKRTQQPGLNVAELKQKNSHPEDWELMKAKMFGDI